MDFSTSPKKITICVVIIIVRLYYADPDYKIIYKPQFVNTKKNKMKKLLYTILNAMLALCSSCEKDAPEPERRKIRSHIDEQRGPALPRVRRVGGN